MSLNIEELQRAFPDRLWLQIPTASQSQLSLTDFSNRASYDNARQNRMCLDAFLAWMAQNPDIPSSPKPVSNAEELPSIWEFINGTPVTIGDQRIILIPSDSIDTLALTIPKEWVDIPQLSADYYIAVQVNEEDGWLQYWGYTAYDTIKKHARYAPVYQNYHLDRDFLIPDLDLIWLTQAMGLAPKKQIAATPVLESQEILSQLTVPLNYSPRLEVAFDQWASILANSTLRGQLYHRRIQPHGVAQPLTEAFTQTKSLVMNAALWLKDQVDQVATELQWQLLPTHRYSLEPVLMRSSSHELQQILTQLHQEDCSVPSSAACIEQELVISNQTLKLYALVWQVLEAEAFPEWCLLAILTGTPDTPLDQGTLLKIFADDDTSPVVLTESDETKHYVCGAVSGSWNETFQISVTLPDGASVTSPHIVFQPDTNS